MIRAIGLTSCSCFVYSIGIRYEARNQSKDKSTGGAPDWMTELDAPSNNGFELEMEYLKALPKGEETDFVLVSCGGAGLEDGEDRDKLVKVRVYFYLFPYKLLKKFLSLMLSKQKLQQAQ